MDFRLLIGGDIGNVFKESFLFLFMTDTYVIEGMTYETYDESRDPHGEIAQALADRRWEEMKGIIPKKELRETEDSGLAKQVKIALRRFPECVPGEIIHVVEVKRRFSELRRAGYTFDKPYSRMSAREAWGYLAEVRRDLREQARMRCPEVLREVEVRNKRQIRDAYID